MLTIIFTLHEDDARTDPFAKKKDADSFRSCVGRGRYEGGGAVEVSERRAFFHFSQPAVFSRRLSSNDALRVLLADDRVNTDERAPVR